MKKIPLRNKDKKVIAWAIVDDDDFERLSGWKWHLNNKGYPVRTYQLGHGAKTRKTKVRMLAHEVMKMEMGEKREVDHRDRNPKNNQKENLRFATRSQQMMNRSRKNKTGYRGVSWHRQNKLWFARVAVNKKLVFAEYFKNKISAARAYDLAAIKYHGEFALLNFPK